MFGIGFTELILISIIAILFLGPDKLPQAMIDIAKFIKSVKKTINDAKGSLEEEMKIADLKEEALSYKKQLDDATSELKNFKNIDFDDFDDDVSYDEEISTKSSKELAGKSESYDSDKLVPAPQEDTTSTPIEQKQDETVVLKKKSRKTTKVASTESSDKSTDDTPKDNA
ncbi:Sec-independent protein translocase protein TatB [Sulfurovum sp.]|uniref:Sec-independent protein translocase protein TatB n=1 Tax=Sulfurovum sp. TaxID=1969726 RepID=UPI002867BB6B|nr:Sec-independent protein translocase protein TatB [Sulfurovum sp.]